jgi:hypothetical protein
MSLGVETAIIAALAVAFGVLNILARRRNLDRFRKRVTSRRGLRARRETDEPSEAQDDSSSGETASGKVRGSIGISK